MKTCKWCQGSGRIPFAIPPDRFIGLPNFVGTHICSKCHGKGFKDIGHATGGYFRRGRDNKS